MHRCSQIVLLAVAAVSALSAKAMQVPLIYPSHAAPIAVYQKQLEAEQAKPLYLKQVEAESRLSKEPLSHLNFIHHHEEPKHHINLIQHHEEPKHHLNLIHHEEPKHHPKYSFGYDVHDMHTGDIKTHREQRDGDKVEGMYSLIDSDGHKRIVKYHADHHTGFHAIVNREPTDIRIPLPHHYHHHESLTHHEPLIQHHQHKQPIIQSHQKAAEHAPLNLIYNLDRYDMPLHEQHHAEPHQAQPHQLQHQKAVEHSPLMYSLDRLDVEPQHTHHHHPPPPPPHPAHHHFAVNQ